MKKEAEIEHVKAMVNVAIMKQVSASIKIRQKHIVGMEKRQSMVTQLLQKFDSSKWVIIFNK